MRTKFSLFQSHLDLAHSYWRQTVEVGDEVVDATAGNGHDSLIIAQLALGQDKGSLSVFDQQKEALEQTKHKLEEAFPSSQWKQLHYYHQCHSQFPSDWLPSSKKLFVYNLGYLPGGDHSVTTSTETTLVSVRQALVFVKPGGAISITCYPGHEEGAKEEKALLKWTESLSPREWNGCFHSWPNRKKSPSLLILQKAVA